MREPTVLPLPVFPGLAINMKRLFSNLTFVCRTTSMFVDGMVVAGEKWHSRRNKNTSCAFFEFLLLAKNWMLFLNYYRLLQLLSEILRAAVPDDSNWRFADWRYVFYSQSPIYVKKTLCVMIIVQQLSHCRQLHAYTSHVFTVIQRTLTYCTIINTNPNQLQLVSLYIRRSVERKNTRVKI